MMPVLDALVDEGPNKALIDITGLLSHNLLALMRLIYDCKKLEQVTFAYAAPSRYRSDTTTEFASSASEVKLVLGYEGYPEIGAFERDRLIIGLGYDDHLIRSLCVDRPTADIRVVFGLPALQPDMYSDSWLRTLRVEEELGPEALSRPIFAPANGPFATAEVLAEEVKRSREAGINNVYLCPLGPRPMVLGFGLYYLAECIDSTVGCLLPFPDRHFASTSEGLSTISLYDIDFGYLRASGAA